MQEYLAHRRVAHGLELAAPVVAGAIAVAGLAYSLLRSSFVRGTRQRGVRASSSSPNDVTNSPQAAVKALFAPSITYSSMYCGGDLPTRLMTRG